MNQLAFMTNKKLITFAKTNFGQHLLVGLVLLAVWLASSWALLRPEFFLVHDYVHAARVAELLRALQDGQFPVRWSENFGYGYGMPLFEFYAPLPFYVGAAFWWLGVPIVVVLKILWAGCSLFTLWGGYKLGKILWGKSGGLVLASLLTLAPYRAVNLYVRGSLSEAWGIMAMPWILYGGIGIWKGKAWGWWVLIAGLVTLMLSHNLTTLMFVPVSVVILAGYGLSMWWRERGEARQKVLFRGGLIGFGFALSIGMTAFYLFPALIEKDFTIISRILSGYFHYSQHFLYLRQLITPYWGYGGSNWGPEDGISFFLGYGQWLGLFGVGVLLLVSSGWLWRQKTAAAMKMLRCNWLWFGGFSLLLGGSVFMSLQRSLALWDAVPFLSFIQFPWRWLSVVAMMISLLVAWSLTLITNQKWRWLYALLLIGVTAAINWSYFRPDIFLENVNAYYYTDEEPIQKWMSGILPDYIPKQMSDPLTPPKSLFLVPGGLESQVEVLVDRGHERLLKTSFLSPAVLDFTIADFPGWVVEIDGEPVEKKSGANGGIAVEVPAGEHLVGAYFGSTPVRWWSDLVSLISGFIFLVTVVTLRSETTDTTVTAPVQVATASVEKAGVKHSSAQKSKSRARRKKRP